MSHFFKSYPVVSYDINNDNHPQLVTDITRRFRLEQVTKNSKLIFYDYEIKEHDRPDIMAEKYYGDSRLDWLFFITNEIFDTYFQWPLNYKQFNDYMIQKYGSISSAHAQTHHYEQIIQARDQSFSHSDGSVNIIPERVLTVDQTTYTSLAATARRSVTTFDFEENENNRKRIIKILDKAFVPGIMQQFKTIFG